MKDSIESIKSNILAGHRLSVEEARFIAGTDIAHLPILFAASAEIRTAFFGNRVSLCGIINAKSGRCPENCSFCAQSAHHSTNAPVYPLLDDETIFAGARAAASSGCVCYGIVTSGSSISAGHELDRICGILSSIRSTIDISPGASLGMLDFETARFLKQSGLVTYHHNLETSRSYFPEICTSHDYEDDIATVRAAGEAGLRVCSGALFGLGETMEHRIELAMTLRELKVDSVPINFLDPVAGTPLEGSAYLTPLECLHIIALFRFILPDVHITICGGREKNLRELHSWVFLAGASGVMTGDYLTKGGRSPIDDIRMVSDLGLEISRGELP